MESNHLAYILIQLMSLIEDLRVVILVMQLLLALAINLIFQDSQQHQLSFHIPPFVNLPSLDMAL
jgi:hypothetical protein